MKKIVAFLGQAGTGKDTAADYLCKTYGFTKVAFADKVKRIAADLYDFDRDTLWGPSETRNRPSAFLMPDGKPLTARIACQVIGTEMARSLYQNTWVDATLKIANALLSTSWLGYLPHQGVVAAPGRTQEHAGVVIPDCRFLNEVKAVQEAGGIVVRLRRDLNTKASGVGVQGHASEMEQLSIPDSQFDYVIDIENGLPNYYKQLDELMEKINGR